jgi:hypothetical protein
MPRAQWRLRAGCPAVQVHLTRTRDAAVLVRNLLADTGAGTSRAGFELLLNEQDCLDCGGPPIRRAVLGGAYSGTFPVSLLRVQIPVLSFNRNVPVVGVGRSPSGFDGIACFRFLNRFTYGNFGDSGAFGLDV